VGVAGKVVPVARKCCVSGRRVLSLRTRLWDSGFGVRDPGSGGLSGRFQVLGLCAAFSGLGSLGLGLVWVLVLGVVFPGFGSLCLGLVWVLVLISGSLGLGLVWVLVLISGSLGLGLMFSGGAGSPVFFRRVNCSIDI